MMNIMYKYQKEVIDNNASAERDITEEHKSGTMDPSRSRILTIKVMKKF